MSGRCPHAGPCPGCPTLDRPRAERLEALGAEVRAALAPYPELGRLDVERTFESPREVGYRTRAKWMVGRGGALGLFRAGTHEVEDLPGCLVLRPALAEAAAALRALCASPPVAAGPALVAHADGGALRGVDLREVVAGGAPRVLATLVLAAGGALERAHALAAAEAWVARAPSIVSVAASLHRGGPQALGSEHDLLLGAADAPDLVSAGGPPHVATHGAFVQANRDVAAAIERDVLDAVFFERRAPRVLELFAGSGALALAAAARGATVDAVEAFTPAIDRLERAARTARLGSRLRGHAMDATAAITRAAARGDAFDAVVVNPPRRGLSPSLREALGALRPALCAYVSCDPETLARDLSHLARVGLGTRRAQPYEMLPMTGHVETVVFLSPVAPPPPRVLFEDESLVAVDKPPHEPTTPQGEHARSLLDRVRALPDMAAAVPVHRLDAGTSGVCLFARRPSLVAPLAAALAAGEKRYLALVRGIIRPKGSIARPLKDEGRTLEATTRYVRRRIVGGHSLVEARPAEGRTHQIRRHLASIDHAVLGDERHGHAPSNRHVGEKHALDRTFLHCARITLALEGGERTIESPLAPDLELVLARLARGG